MIQGNIVEAAKPETLDSAISSIDGPINILNEIIGRLQNVASSLAGPQIDIKQSVGVETPVPDHFIGLIIQKRRTLNFQVNELMDVTAYLERSLAS